MPGASTERASRYRRGRGIGRAIAQRLPRRAPTSCGVGRTVEPLEETVALRKWFRAPADLSVSADVGGLVRLAANSPLGPDRRDGQQRRHRRRTPFLTWRGELGCGDRQRTKGPSCSQRVGRVMAEQAVASSSKRLDRCLGRDGPFASYTQSKPASWLNRTMAVELAPHAPRERGQPGFTTRT